MTVFFFLKRDDWDYIFSVWQSGQYRAPAIKPLPINIQPELMSFPWGGRSCHWGFKHRKEGFRAHSQSWHAGVYPRKREQSWTLMTRKQRPRNETLIGLNRTDLQAIWQSLKMCLMLNELLNNVKTSRAAMSHMSPNAPPAHPDKDRHYQHLRCGPHVV